MQDACSFLLHPSPGARHTSRLSPRLQASTPTPPSMPLKDRTTMHVVASVTPENLITVGLRRESFGELPEQADLATLTPQETRALASILVSRAEVAERRARQGAR